MLDWERDANGGGVDEDTGPLALLLGVIDDRSAGPGMPGRSVTRSSHNLFRPGSLTRIRPEAERDAAALAEAAKGVAADGQP